MSFSLKQKAQFYQKLYTGIKAGLDLPVLLSGGILPAVFLPALQQASKDIQAGVTLSAALQAARAISPWEAKLLGIGESAGRMEVVIADLRSYFEDRSTDYQLIKNRLIYPVLVLVVAITVLPLPGLANGSVAMFSYLTSVLFQLTAVVLLYKIAVQWPFERSSMGAFNPVLLKVLNWIKPDSWLRLDFEISYLNLLTICQESGLTAAETLRLLKEGCPDKQYRLKHTQAISQIENKGSTLSEVLANNGIIQHWMVKSFLVSSERSGTLHSDLRTFVVTKKARISEDVRHTVKKLSLWFYVLLLLFGARLI